MQRISSYNQYDRSRRGRDSSDLASIVRILVSFFVIVLSILAIYVVVIRVMDIKILEKINLKDEPHDSLNITTDANSGTSFFVTDEKGLKFRKEDKSFAREEWIEKNGELFYFDTAGYGLNGDLKREGQVYTFENGKLKHIKRDTSYVSRAKDELFSSLESAQYLVWLVDDEKTGNFYPIKFKQYSDDFEDYLGTEADKQFASPNMIKIYMSNIYYLAAGKGTNYAGRLYRMRPNAIHKETVGIGVTGFIVLSDEVVYYCDGERVLKAKSWKGVDLKLPENEELNDDGEIVVKVSTKSDATPVVNEAGKALEINIANLPKPDKEVKIVDGTGEETTSSRETTLRASNEKESTTANVQVGISPGDISNQRTSAVRDERVEIGAGPKVVEVEAPR
ncbi:MAG: hypothetical protein IKI71_00525 [Lachnospiraceae bacterium]|nr:hypothetical protein [Lachnospiraceae bacterium]